MNLVAECTTMSAPCSSGRIAVEQRRVGPEQQHLVESEQNVELLRCELDAVLRLPEREPVVGQLHFAAQHVVVGDEPLLLHPADVAQPELRLLDIAGEHLLFTVEAEELEVLFEQVQFHLGAVARCPEHREPLFEVGLADGVADASSLIEGLGQVHGVVLRPVGRIGTIGVRQSVAEDDGLADKTAPEPHLEVGIACGAGRTFAFPCGLLLHGVGLEREAVADALLEELLDGQEELVGLRQCGDRSGGCRVGCRGGNCVHALPTGGKTRSQQSGESDYGDEFPMHFPVYCASLRVRP